jgi:hypothetical protein
MTPEVNPMYNEVRYNNTPHFFETKEKAERFKKESRRAGMKTTDVIDLESIPF